MVIFLVPITANLPSHTSHHNYHLFFGSLTLYCLVASASYFLDHFLSTLSLLHLYELPLEWGTVGCFFIFVFSLQRQSQTLNSPIGEFPLLSLSLSSQSILAPASPSLCAVASVNSMPVGMDRHTCLKARPKRDSAEISTDVALEGHWISISLTLSKQERKPKSDQGEEVQGNTKRGKTIENLHRPR